MSEQTHEESQNKDQDRPLGEQEDLDKKENTSEELKDDMEEGFEPVEVDLEVAGKDEPEASEDENQHFQQADSEENSSSDEEVEELEELNPSVDWDALLDEAAKHDLDEARLLHLQGAMETILYMNDKPLSLPRLRNLVDQEVPLKIYRKLIHQLMAEYDRPHHGFALQEVALGFQFRTKPVFSKYIQAVHKVVPVKLSRSAMEVLAIVAYKQPATKTEVDEVRGVDSSHGIRTLLEKRMIRITGRSEKMGRPALYGTTQDFLEFFGLKDVKDLPSMEELKEMIPKSEVGNTQNIQKLVKEETSLDFEEDLDLDAIREQVKNIQTSTRFTDELTTQEKLKGKGAEEAASAKSAFDVLEDMVGMTEDGDSSDQNAEDAESGEQELGSTESSEERSDEETPSGEADERLVRARQFLEGSLDNSEEEPSEPQEPDL